MSASPTDNRLQIRLCMGSSCFARGNNKALEILQHYLAANGLEELVELSGALCEGRCNDGPLLFIGHQAYHHVDPRTVIDMLRHHLEPATAAKVP